MQGVLCTPRKFFFCALLLLQNVTQVMLTRYSLLHHNDDTLEDITKIEVGKHPYLATVATVVDDSLKLFFCLCILFVREKYSVSNLCQAFKVQIIDQPRQFIKLSFPALLYVVQDNLTLLALANIEPAQFQMLFQLKIIFTAIFSVLFLRRSIACSQWFSLIFLVCGVGVLTYNGERTFEHMRQGHEFTGVVAVLLACVTSAVAGTYFEMYFKEDSCEKVDEHLSSNESIGLDEIYSDDGVESNPHHHPIKSITNVSDDSRMTKSVNNITYDKVGGFPSRSNREKFNATTAALETNAINLDSASSDSGSGESLRSSDKSSGSDSDDSSASDLNSKSKMARMQNEMDDDEKRHSSSSNYCSTHRKSRHRQYHDIPLNMWMSELSLAIWSIPFGVAGILVKDLQVVTYHGLFTGFSPVVLGVIAITATGGLFSLIVVMELDNIVKNLTNSLSFVPVTVLCFYLFHFHPQPSFFIGAAIVLLAVTSYCHPIDCSCLAWRYRWSRSRDMLDDYDSSKEMDLFSKASPLPLMADDECDHSQENVFLKTTFIANNASSASNFNSTLNLNNNTTTNNNNNNSDNNNNNSDNSDNNSDNNNNNINNHNNNSNINRNENSNDDNVARPMSHTNFSNNGSIIHTETDDIAFVMDSSEDENI